MIIENYGDIVVSSEGFCRGCQERDLQIHEEKLYADGTVVRHMTTLACEKIDHCRRLAERIERMSKILCKEAKV